MARGTAGVLREGHRAFDDVTDFNAIVASM
jgi:hypothetical protein